VFYFVGVPKIYRAIDTEGGSLVLLNPVSLNKSETVLDYTQLKTLNKVAGKSSVDDVIYSYKYALSFWFNISSDLAFTSYSYDTRVTILDYNGIPTVSYKPDDNSLYVSMLNEGDIDKVEYCKTNVLLQKWNNIVIQYSAGILDIFINGVLEKSINGVIPKMSVGNLVVGQTGGISGSICSIIYFTRILNIFEVQRLYNSLKDKSPPIGKYAKQATIQSASATTAQSQSLSVAPDQALIADENGAQAVSTNNNFSPAAMSKYVDYISQRWSYSSAS